MPYIITVKILNGQWVAIYRGGDMPQNVPELTMYGLCLNGSLTETIVADLQQETIIPRIFAIPQSSHFTTETASSCACQNVPVAGIGGRSCPIPKETDDMTHVEIILAAMLFILTTFVVASAAFIAFA